MGLSIKPPASNGHKPQAGLADAFSGADTRSADRLVPMRLRCDSATQVPDALVPVLFQLDYSFLSPILKTSLYLFSTGLFSCLDYPELLAVAVSLSTLSVRKANLQLIPGLAPEQ